MNKPNLPPMNDPNMARYLRDHAAYVEMELRRRTADVSARDSVILLSPDGAAWEVRVDNTGALTTTKLAG